MRRARALSLALPALALMALVQLQVPPSSSSAIAATLHGDTPGPVVNRNIYGHFAEHLGRGIYEGIWVGPDSPIPNTRGIRNDVVAALGQLDIPVLRWPGGCFADEYHWKDGIGPRDRRPSMINTHWGGAVENNHFGTHEFMDLIEMLGADAYITGNVGSGTVQEMMEWVEYLTSGGESPMANLRRKHGRDEPWRVTYFGVGNESWGCGGNMRPEYYADEYRRYNTFIKNYDRTHPIFRIAGGSDGNDLKWTEVLMSVAGTHMNGLSVHYYTLPTGNWRAKGSATAFAEDQWFSTLSRAVRLDDVISKHAAIMDRFDPEKRVGMIVDEWGTWYDVEPGTEPGFLYQQNTLRDALVAALSFHIFHAHADRVVMANIAQTINVLQAMILTDLSTLPQGQGRPEHSRGATGSGSSRAQSREDAPKMLRTPTYWVFDMYKGHQGGTVLPVAFRSPEYAFGDQKMDAISVSATRAASGVVHLSVANVDPSRSFVLSVRLAGIAPKSVSGRVLTAPAITTHNTFAAPDAVKPATFDGAILSGDTLELRLPAKSVVVVELR